MEKLDTKQEIQENMYTFPYHHIPKYVNGNFSAIRAHRGAHQYIASINFLISKISELKFSKLLDVGCDDGKFLNEISRKISSKTYVGIDYSENAILFAKAMSPKIEFICGDITCDKLNLEKFDIITLVETLEHIKPDLIPDVIKSLYRHLEQEGKIIITVPTTNVPTSPKHYQHFNLELLKETLFPYFKIDEYYFINKISLEAKIIKSLLANRIFSLNHQPTLNKLFEHYEKKSFQGNKTNSEGIFIICSINKDKIKQ